MIIISDPDWKWARKLRDEINLSKSGEAVSASHRPKISCYFSELWNLTFLHAGWGEDKAILITSLHFNSYKRFEGLTLAYQLCQKKFDGILYIITEKQPSNSFFNSLCGVVECNPGMIRIFSKDDMQNIAKLAIHEDFLLAQ